MAKHRPDNAPHPDPDPRRQPLKKPSDELIRIAILSGVAALVVIAGMNLYETRRQRIGAASDRARPGQGLHRESGGSAVPGSQPGADHDC